MCKIYKGRDVLSRNKTGGSTACNALKRGCALHGRHGIIWKSKINRRVIVVNKRARYGSWWLGSIFRMHCYGGYIIVIIDF